MTRIAFLTTTALLVTLVSSAQASLLARPRAFLSRRLTNERPLKDGATTRIGKQLSVRGGGGSKSTVAQVATGVSAAHGAFTLLAPETT